MRSTIVSIGEEVLRAEIANTNLEYLTKSLMDSGLDPVMTIVVGDSLDEIKKALDAASMSSDVIITTGGLGPTQDDLTRQAVSEYLGIDCVRSDAVAESIDAVFERRGMKTPEINYVQAQVPIGARVVPNEFGTAPGLVIRKNSKTYILLPGPPRELVPMWVTRILPELASELRTFSRDFHVFGLTESEVAQRLDILMTSKEPPFVAPYATLGDIRLRVWAKARTQAEFDGLIKPAVALMHEKLSPNLFELPLEAEVGKFLKDRGWTLSTAESCTGGLIAKTVTDVAGSSEWFLGGAVTYSNRSKSEILGVKQSTLDQFGAVSQEAALEMAEGAARVFGSSCSVSTTGIAGPGGGSEGKPVGLVFIGLKTPGKTQVFRQVFSGTRADIRHRTMMFALTRLILSDA